MLSYSVAEGFSPILIEPIAGLHFLESSTGEKIDMMSQRRAYFKNSTAHPEKTAKSVFCHIIIFFWKTKVLMPIISNFIFVVYLSYLNLFLFFSKL
jgi:hypothetical protein